MVDTKKLRDLAVEVDEYIIVGPELIAEAAEEIDLLRLEFEDMRLKAMGLSRGRVCREIDNLARVVTDYVDANGFDTWIYDRVSMFVVENFRRYIEDKKKRKEAEEIV